MRSKKMLFVILLVCCSLFIVHAKENEVFKYDWTKVYDISSSEEAYFHNKAYYDYGYITSDLVLNDDEYATKIVKYDLKGEVVKEAKLSDILIFYLEVHNDYIYAIGIKTDSEDDVYFVAKMNFDFEIENEYIDEDDVLLPFYYINLRDYFSVFAFKDEQIVLFCDDGFLFLDKNFKKVEIKSSDDMTDEEYNEILELYSLYSDKFDELYDDYEYVDYFAVKDDIEAYFLEKDDKVYLKVYQDDKELFTKRLSSSLFTYYNMQSVKIINDYVFVVTTERISIYDLNGDKVQTIYLEDALEMANIKSSDDYYYTFYNLVAGDNGFIYSICEINDDYNVGRVLFTSSLCTSIRISGVEADILGFSNSQDIFDVKEGHSYYGISKIYDQVWYLPVNILTKSDGNGQVEAVETARYGDEITFKVFPNKGYVLKAVKVTDSEGKTIVFTDNTFTVLNKDVTIEATFVPKNPDTSVGILLFIILFVISGGATIIYFHSKYKVKEMN